MSKQVLQMKYHPAKKEIFFARYVAGKEIPIRSDSKLNLYMNKRGKFVLQDHGKQFFDDIAEAFDGEKSVAIEVVTTKSDYEDFEQMIEYYNVGSKIKVTATLLSELPDMEETYRVVRDHGEKSITTLTKHRSMLFEVPLDNANTKKCVETFAADVQKEVDSIQEKIEKMSDNSINLCFAGVYSAGKSALINAILGYQILPEAIKSETARMFKIQSPKAGEPPRIIFSIRDSYAELLWNEKVGTFDFGAAPTEDNTRKEIQETINEHKTDAQHHQIFEILKKLNSSDDVNADIKIFFPIPLDGDRVQFTIYDTPGTDSNFGEHQMVLQDALSEQTHSILVFVAAPNKTEGEGNNALLSYLKEAENKDSKTSIDIGRSLFVINWADSIGPDERCELQNAKIKDKTDDSFSIKLSDKKLFFTSAKVAYAAKAKVNGINTKAEEYTIKQQSATISDEEFGRYYRQNRVATSESATKKMLALCDDALAKAESSNDILEVLHICSGLFALETEIAAYGEKYAAAVKAFAIIDSVDKALSAMNRNAKSLERQNQEDINHIEQEIAELKSTIFGGIKQAYKKHDCPEGTSLPAEMLKSLHFDSAYLYENITEKTLHFFEKLLKGWFFGLGKVKFSEKHKTEITQRITTILLDYTTEFLEEREKLLIKIRDTFIEEVQCAIRNNGSLSQAAKNYVLEIRRPDIKTPTNIIEFGDMYDSRKQADKFLWMDTQHIDRDGFVQDADRKMTEIATNMIAEFETDFRSTLKSVLSAIESEFTQNIENYSVLMQAKLEDKKVMEQLRTKIADAARDLQSCQDELNKVIWSVK